MEDINTKFAENDENVRNYEKLSLQFFRQSQIFNFL